MAVERFRLPNGDVVVFDEWLHWPVYSVIEWAATSGINLRAFSYVRGQRVPTLGVAARNATTTDTNQVAKARMNWDESYRLFSITYEPFGLTNETLANSPSILVAQAPQYAASNLRRLQRDVVVEFFVGADIEKPQVRAPFSYYHQGIGPVVYTSGDSPAAGIAFSHGTGGYVSWSSQRRFSFPVKIGGDRVMYLKTSSAFGPVAGLSQDTQLRWYMDGVRRRPLG
jgi:hypothetical protein